MRIIGRLIAVCLLLWATNATAQRSPELGQVVSAAEAHSRATKGEVVLVDVRTADEWNETGLPASGHALTMHQEPRIFLQRLTQLMGSDRTKPVAIICRTGNRTTMLQAELRKAGFTNVINVAEGMVGGPHGQGWIKTGLPIRPGTASASPPAVSPAAVIGK